MPATDPSPLVSICVPTYNVQKTIYDTLVSLINQTYINFIVLIVDNASTDKTLEIVSKFEDSRIHIYKSSENIGGEGNFNRCIELAKGKYTAIYHADDIYAPDIIELQVAYLETHLSAGAIFTQANLIDENGVNIGNISLPKKIKNNENTYEFFQIFKAIMRHSNFLVCPSAMLRTNIYQNEIKKFRGELFNTSSDLDVWFRVLQNHSIGILPERLINYRISKSQHSAKLRARITKSDFFLVMEYYLAKEKVKTRLVASDYLYYARVERTDRILRAVNFYLQGDFQSAILLNKNLPILDTITAAMTSRKGFITMLASVFLRVFMFINKPKIGQFLLTRMKQVVGK